MANDPKQPDKEKATNSGPGEAPAKAGKAPDKSAPAGPAPDKAPAKATPAPVPAKDTKAPAKTAPATPAPAKGTKAPDKAAPAAPPPDKATKAPDKAAPAPVKDGKAPAKAVPFPGKGKESAANQAAKKEVAATPAPKAPAVDSKAAPPKKYMTYQEAEAELKKRKAAEASEKKPGKPTAKATPAAKATMAPAEKPKPPEPTLEEQRAKIEAELREKFGIPKSEQPTQPWVAPKTEKVIRIPHDEIHPFKGHTFDVDTTAPKFLALAASIRARGVGQPAVVRPREGGGYEMVSGHRRDAASIAAEIPYTPCIVRALNDDQAIQQMVEDNLTSRDISTIELARSLKTQLDSIKHQGARQAIDGGELTDAAAVGVRSNQVVAERNGMSVKQVQRYVALNNLTPSLQEYLDEGKVVEGSKPLKIAFVTAVELSALKPENQEYVALAIEGEQSTPNTAQAKEIRQYDKEGYLNMMDVIDGVMKQEKKEAINVTLSGAELEKYFGKGQLTPREMKDKILEALDKSYPPQQRVAAKDEKKADKQK